MKIVPDDPVMPRKGANLVVVHAKVGNALVEEH
jgi:hypothetical protein